ncbi:MAG: hypothetical protein KAS22_02605 [Candidatus Heimdallarchaeota archaeon]|nr:hypothetical protein [Candidatus Heimdallarchaeota archaeon]
MNYTNFISKKALDKNGEKLGKIIRIEDLIGKTIKKYKPYTIVQVNRFLRRKIFVTIDLEKVIKEQESHVLFDISKEDFEVEIKRIEVLRKERETFDDHVPTSWVTAGGGSDYRPKPRRKKK